MFFEGKAQAAREARRLAAWSAWYAGVIAKSKDTPKLSELMAEAAGDEPTPARRQTAAEQLAIAMRWNTWLRGKTIYREEC